MYIDLLSGLLLIAALVLSVLGMPGSLLAIAPILLWGLWGGSITFSAGQSVVLILLCVLSEGFEQLGFLVGMKVIGVHSYGIWGSIIGAFVGIPLAILFLNPLLIMVTIVGGSYVGELMAGKTYDEALWAVLGFLLGKFGGYIAKNVLFLAVLGYIAGTYFLQIFF